MTGTQIAGRRRRRLWQVRVVVSLASVAAVGLLLSYVRVIDHPWYLSLAIVLTLGFAIAATTIVLSEHGPRVGPAQWSPAFDREAAHPPGGMDLRLMWLRRQVAEVVERREDSPELRELLSRLAAAALLERHDIDMQAEPERAAKLLHPDLIAYLNSPAPSGPTARPMRALTRAIDRIEEI